jgi:hypothetical protein
VGRRIEERFFISSAEDGYGGKPLKSEKPQITWGFLGFVLHGNKERFS